MRALAFAVGVLALSGCVLARVSQLEEGGPLDAAVSVSTLAADYVDSSDSSVPTASAADPDSLTLAAECLERGDRARAAAHLEDYVCRHPDQWMFRVQLAEMLLALGRDALARAHFERFIADAPSSTGPAR